MRQILLASLVCLLGVCLHPVSARAAAKLVNVENYAYQSPVSFKQDITGDGKNDSIKITPYDQNYTYYKKVKVTVNGKKLVSFASKYDYYALCVQYFSLSKSKNFLRIQGLADSDGIAFDRIYRYDKKTKKLVKAADLTGYGAHSDAIEKVSSSQIQVRFSCQPPETGRINWLYTFLYKDGKFKLKSSTASVRSSLVNYDNGDGYIKYFRKNQFKVSNSFPLYTSTNLKKKAFTAKKGKLLTLSQIKISGKNTYLKFKYNGKSGWQKVYRSPSVYDYSKPNYQDTGWFYGVCCRLAG